MSNLHYGKDASALTGGIATGKSTAAALLAQQGAHIIDTDIIAREIVQPGMPALKEICKSFGSGMLRPDGTLNREAMRNCIINDSTSRLKLNSITHPHILKRTETLFRNYKELNDRQPTIIDIPLLYEVSWDKHFDFVVLVYATPAIQAERLMKRDRIDYATAIQTLSAQINIDEKRASADFIIDNSGTRENTEKQVLKLYEVMRSNILNGL